jgi:hypothetical protein
VCSKASVDDPPLQVAAIDKRNPACEEAGFGAPRRSAVNNSGSSLNRSLGSRSSLISMAIDQFHRDDVLVHQHRLLTWRAAQ